MEDRNQLNIGIFADCLKLPLRDGIRKAAELGASSFQMYTSFGPNQPETLSISDRAELRKYYEDQGIVLSAICADYWHGFTNREKNLEVIPKMRLQVDLALDLGTSIITTHIGVVPPEHNETWETLRSALNEIGGYLESRGVVFACETGPESGPVLRDLLESLDNRAIRVNFDPANLAMCGFDVLEAVDALMPYIVHTHAKDGLREGDRMREVPLGQGAVPWTAYIERLRSAGYTGAFTIEREEGEDPIGDTAKAVAFLKGL